MSKPLWQQICEADEDIVETDFGANGPIVLRDDSDGLGTYIEKWDHFKEIPNGYKIGK